MDAAPFLIRPARTQPDIDAVAQLFHAYAGSIGIDLGYQDFPAEVAELPGKYAPPRGELLIAPNAGGEAVGCVAMRPIAPDGCCEMKRLYVAPAGRGAGLGMALAAAIVGAAERLGYREMRLDTLPTMTGAISLYRKLGFTPIAPYYDTPVAGTIFLARRLGPSG
jgi:ribosomal protein S18 acetylase RimI-like enzyme